MPTTSPSIRRCRHQMVPEQCGICLRLVTRENQTREYGGGDVEDLYPDVPPRVLNQEMEETGPSFVIPEETGIHDFFDSNLPEEEVPLTETPTETEEPEEREEPETEEEHEMDEKVCSKCNRSKPLDEFNKAKSGKFGRKVHCRVCEHEYQKQFAAKKAGKTIIDADAPGASAKPRRMGKRNPSKPAGSPRRKKLLSVPMAHAATLTTTFQEVADHHLVLDLCDYPEILEALKAAAKKHIRTPEHQAIACVHLYLVQENYIRDQEKKPEFVR